MCRIEELMKLAREEIGLVLSKVSHHTHVQLASEAQINAVIIRLVLSVVLVKADWKL